MKRKIEKNILDSQVVERPVRKAVQFPAHLLSEDNRYSGFIINISSRGVGLYIDTNFPESTIDCDTESVLKLELQSPFGERIRLHCKIRWLRIKQSPENGATTSMGMEVLDPPEGFVKLFHSLS